MKFTQTLYKVQEIEKIDELLSGSNQNQVLIVLDVNDKVHSEFLTKIISSIGLDIEHVLSLYLPDESQLRIIDFISKNNIKKLIVFGSVLHRICINVKPTFFEKFELNQVDFLIANSLQETVKNKELKKNLWVGLKEMFNI